jgi:HK/GC/Chemotaxis protein-like, sensor domain
MLTKRLSLLAALALSLMLISAYGCAAPTAQEIQLKTTTMQIQQALQSELDSLDHDLSVAAVNLSRTAISGPEAQQILNRLYDNYRFTFFFAVADPSGKIIATAPEGYSSFEGLFITSENIKKPELKEVALMGEAYYTAALTWPVLSHNGDTIGSVSALFEPKKLFVSTVAPESLGTGMAVNIMQLDGLNIYDSQGNDTRKNLFTDPEFQSYKDLIAFGHKMASRESGSGSYTFIDHATGKTVKKVAFWASIGLHGTSWRVACIQPVAD